MRYEICRNPSLVQSILECGDRPFKRWRMIVKARPRIIEHLPRYP